MAVLTRPQALQQLYDYTMLPVSTILGAFGILDKAGLATTPANIAAAAWSSYKMYETAVTQKASDFRKILGSRFPHTDLATDEMRKQLKAKLSES